MEMDFAAIEKKWQERWASEKVFEVKEDDGKKKYYILEMFPYPSGTGLHMGHAWNYTIGDIIARFKIMKGFNVLHPMGYDALGLPAENAAIKVGTHPEKYTNDAIENYKKQQKALGISYDWSRVVNTASPEYYRWDQWIFLKMLEKGLAYQKTSAVNWCGECNTVLANEQVENGKCWRHEDRDVEVKHLKQWFFKTTEYADELYENLDNMDWPERTKAMQKNWIGKSHGVEIDFEVAGESKFASYLLIEKSFKIDLEKELKEFGEVEVESIDKDWGKFFRINVPIDKENEFIDFVKKNILVENEDGGSWYVDSGGTTNNVIFRNKVINLNSGSGKREFFEYGKKLGMPKEQLDVKVAGESGISNVVIVHGSNSNEKEAKEGKLENERHWKPWLKRELEKRGINVSNNLYSKDWQPRYKEWKKEFEKNEINENTVLVGHSAGCAFLLRWLSENKKKVKKIILVAPYILDIPEAPFLSDLVNFKIDKDIKNYFDELIIFYADNDSNYIIESTKFVNKKLGAKLIELEGMGHFTEKHMGTKEFPELLEEILKSDKKTWSIFTTRPDTIFGVTFMVVSAQHPRLDELVTAEQKDAVAEFLKKVKSVSEKDAGDLEKEGAFTGSFAINPATGERIPIWTGNFVLASYGSGMVMAVPAHDQRDFEFAKKYGIEVKQVVSSEGKIKEKAWTNSGILINSDKFNKINSDEAKEKITDWLIEKKVARRTVNFKLRDWGISRQRYWGTPIPIVYCEKCGVVPVPEKDLPVKLPKNIKFGDGNPLETAEDWVNADCPKCGGKGRRETDTMDTFVNSSWYFLRYCDPKNSEKIFDSKKADYWCPVDTYIGGAEHACMHLIYSRFYVKFLRDLGLINFDEPAVRLFHQGMLHAEDGRKMSKSLGNVIDPLDTIKKYGIDATRFFLVSVASPDKDFDWNEKGIIGSLRFMKKVVKFYDEVKIGSDNDEVLSLLNQTIKVSEKEFANFGYRPVSIKLRELFDLLDKRGEASKETLESALKILNPICPHITEEIWEKMGNEGFISTSEWPKLDESKIIKEKQMGNLNEKIIDSVKYLLGKKEAATKVYLYVMPFELEKIGVEEIKKAVGKEVVVFAVNDSGKYDPEGKAKKAKPGKASVYLE